VSYRELHCNICRTRCSKQEVSILISSQGKTTVLLLHDKPCQYSNKAGRKPYWRKYEVWVTQLALRAEMEVNRAKLSSCLCYRLPVLSWQTSSFPVISQKQQVFLLHPCTEIKILKTGTHRQYRRSWIFIKYKAKNKTPYTVQKSEPNKKIRGKVHISIQTEWVQFR